ncbi:hypothetical protein LQ938_03915 [Microbacterium sp. cx-55]|uniref:endonuclease domain-containing protein n=1 Tax=Microbacterium sp. cx-55 TaxID=2875948 RepID=UPI001CBD200C|nr:hypothetical protein [Microbacterium sp. cx-55]MBZ4487038.1 hypothetical protein [Microbacterium sp. cx-55]UGB35956.1 hypothetical protein LQ938_03915 [Microbacterium sp. cx-55]
MSAFFATPCVYSTRADLRSGGYTDSSIARLCRDGEVVRVRRGRYVDASLPAEIVDAARLGGRLDCTSLLRLLGVFVLDDGRLHIQIERGSSRLPHRGTNVHAHWRTTATASSDLIVDPIEALAQACRCLAPRAAVATLDSAWHLGVVDEAGINEVFARLPGRFRTLRRLLDPRSESGPETLVRLMLRAMGVRVDVQAWIPGVGRVDLLVDGWLIIECDSRAFHSDWTQHRNDRRRDSASAARGYVTLRPIAEDIFGNPADVRAAIAGLLSAGPPRRRRANSSRTGRTAALRPATA